MTKSLTWLHDCILLDSSMRCGTDTHRDILTMSRRVKHEGLSFLTITLSNFGRDFDLCLEREFVGTECFLGFKRHRALPQFLGGLLSLVFDTGSGKLLADPSEEAILCIRQICLMYKKVNLRCSLKRTKEALDGYVQCDHELDQTYQSAFSSHPVEIRDVIVNGDCPRPSGSRNGPTGEGAARTSDILFRRRATDWSTSDSCNRSPSKGVLHREFDVVSRVLWTEVLSPLSSSIEGLDLRPKHGPGATAERISGNAKYELLKWHTRLEPYFPFTAFGIPSLNAVQDRIAERVEFVEPGAEQPVRVISVPKTLRAPRIIAIEPVCMQYTQQALADSIVKTIERHPLTAGQINFTDQSINRELARVGSLHRSYGTIDLSEASDRVHVHLVHRLLRAIPTLERAVMACRSTKADLGDGRIVHLNKFASMGSALCFPIESMVFFTICIVGRLQALNLPSTVSNIKNVARRVYVYGDDLIVPADEVPVVTKTLEAFALKVNANKTFYSGRFRESCGMDAYNGVMVTPIYVRCMPPRGKQDHAEIVSYVSLANQLYKAGWWVLAKRVRAVVDKILGPLPVVRETAPCLGWHTLRQTYSIQALDKHTHAWKVRAWVAVPKKSRDLLDGYAALMKCFLLAGENHTEVKKLAHLDIMSKDANHLHETVRRGAVNIKRRWVQPY